MTGRIARAMVGGVVVLLAGALAGCGSQDTKQREFFTSGNREADQRAEQRMTKDEQLKQGDGKENKSNKDNKGGQSQTGAVVTNKPTLYERLGGEQGVKAIVDDFVARALADPRVNWERKGIKRGGVLGYGGKSVEWKPDAGKVETLKTHMAQFFALSTGGPAKYEGREMKQVHNGMKITNAEFDAAVGDLKATLDKLHLATAEQKELLAIVESTRPQVAEER